MGCVCCSLSSFISIVLDALERISLCTVCTMLTCCLMFTIITVTMLGIGIGYHYCFVSHSVAAMGEAAKAAGGLRSGRRAGGGRGGPAAGNVMRSIDKAVKRGVAHRLGRRDVHAPAAFNNNTLNEMLSSQNLTFFNEALMHYNFSTGVANLTGITNLTGYM